MISVGPHTWREAIEWQKKYGTAWDYGKGVFAVYSHSDLAMAMVAFQHVFEVIPKETKDADEIRLKEWCEKRLAEIV